MRLLNTKTLIAGVAALLLATAQNTEAAQITFDDFNSNEGHFGLAPTFSGSTTGIHTNSTADRVTSDGPLEGSGHQRLVLNDDATTVGGTSRLRHLSGGGTPGNNTAFTTSAGEDGWIGLFVKTTQPGWTVQLWIEAPAGNNGGVPKEVIADGEWHAYEWNLDDDTGGPDGWGAIAGILGGLAAVPDGSHTIDSVLFRHTSMPATSTLFIDYVVKSDTGSIADLLGAPCLNTAGVTLTGPISTNSNQVVVTGVTAGANPIKIYQDSGSGMQLLETISTGISAGSNSFTVNGLVKGATVSATQTLNSQESCVPTTGAIVGGGANPSLLAAFSIRETSSTGPIGAAGDTSNTSIHFLGSSTRNGSSSPGEGHVLQPSSEWQTVTFQRGVDPSIGWNGAVAGIQDFISGDWGILDAIAFAVSDLTDSGPYDLYIDDLQNGTTVFQDFESGVVGTTNTFWYPSFASVSAGAVLSNPNSSLVSDLAAFSGTKSLRVQFQWSSLENTKVIRLSTSNPPAGLANPQVNLNEPISAKILLLPVGVTPPPTSPTLSHSVSGNQITFTWSGSFMLQSRSAVETGAWTDVDSSGSYSEPLNSSAAKFFRLRNN